MQGEPKWFNTRRDVENWRAVGGEDAYRSTIEKFYNGRLRWVTTAELEEGQTGITDETHRVLEQPDTETQTMVRYQQELQSDPNAYIFTRLGFTDGECRAILEL